MYSRWNKILHKGSKVELWNDCFSVVFSPFSKQLTCSFHMEMHLIGIRIKKITIVWHVPLMRLHHITRLYLFDSELLNSGKRDLEMLLEAGEGKRMLSLMSWPSYFLYQVPSHLSWTRHPLCAWRSVIWTWGSLIFTNKVSLVQFNYWVILPYSVVVWGYCNYNYCYACSR